MFMLDEHRLALALSKRVTYYSVVEELFKLAVTMYVVTGKHSIRIVHVQSFRDGREV